MGRWLAAALLALTLVGCAKPPPEPQPIPEPPGPGLVGWRSIGFSNELFESGYVQERELNISGPVRRAWIMLNLRESIPIPETGGRALSVRFIGEYRCAERLWRPLEGAVVRQAQCAATRACGTPAPEWVPQRCAGDAGWGVSGCGLWVVRKQTLVCHK
jgi:hypothetical protein